MDYILDRLALGREKYGHGVRVDDDTTTWGTSKNSWMEMAREEFLDGIIYIVADYIRVGRESDKKAGDMEIEYVVNKPGFLETTDVKKFIEEDDNELIKYILCNKELMEPCKHKTLIYSLFSMLECS